MADLRGYQPTFTGGELAPALHARVDLAKYQTGLKKALNVFVHPHGGVSNRAGFEFIGEVKASEAMTRLVGFEFNDDQTYVLEFGDLYMRVWKNGGQVLNLGLPYEIVTPFVTADLQDLVFTQEADVVFVTHRSYAPRKLSRFGDANWTLTTPTFAATILPPTTVRARDKSFAHIAITSVTTGNPAAVNATAHGLTTSQKFTFTEVGAGGSDLLGTIYTVTVVNANQFTLNGVNRSALAAVGACVGNQVFATATAVYQYKVSSISAATGEESKASTAIGYTGNDLAIAAQVNVVSWTAVVGAERYNVYKEDGGIFGYIGGTTGLTFNDENITSDLADTPPQYYNPFIGAGNYPACSTFVDQRLAFASTTLNPQAVWLSKVASYENFGFSRPRKASDGFEFRIRSKKVNEVRSMLQTKGLMLLTSGGEWIVSDGDSAGPTPDSIVSANQGYRGAARIQPIEVGNTVLFAQRLGAVIRDFSYEFAEDSFVGKDLTIMARHLFEYLTVKAWAYAQYPWSMIWVVMSDGSCVSLTYMKEHDVWGWSRHETDGAFEDVVVVPENGEDTPYFIVRRTIGGVEKRYIERLHSRSFTSVEDAFFVDSGLTYSGVPADVISGLDHLNGKTVVALADGNVVRDLEVSGGAITLPFEASVAHIGLPYTATIRTLDLDLGSVRGLGTVQGRLKSISEVTFRVERTRGVWTGPVDEGRDSEKMTEYKQRSTEAWNEAIGLYTGDFRITAMGNWTTGGNVIVSQFDPLPMTILAIMPDITLGA